MKKLRIIIINTSGLGVGGITTHMLNYISALKDQKDVLTDITIVSSMFKEEAIVREFKSLGCRVIFLPDRKKKILSYSIKLNEIMKNNYYDILHVHGNSPTMGLELEIGKKNGIPTRIAHCHNSISSHPLIYKLLNAKFKNTYTSAIAASNKAGNWIFGKNNFTVLSNAIYVNNYRYSPIIRKQYRKQLRLTKATTAIAMIGNINEQKNPTFLRKILQHMSQEQLKHVQFFVIGDGPLKEKMENEIKPFKEYVSWLGVRDDISNLLQAIDILIMPSLWEGLPMVLIEAQSAGVKCIVSDRVSDEVRVVKSNVSQLPLEANCWVTEIQKIEKQLEKEHVDRDRAYEVIKKSPYNIDIAINKLRQIYRI